MLLPPGFDCAVTVLVDDPSGNTKKSEELQSSVDWDTASVIADGEVLVAYCTAKSGAGQKFFTHAVVADLRGPKQGGTKKAAACRVSLSLTEKQGHAIQPPQTQPTVQVNYISEEAAVRQGKCTGSVAGLAFFCGFGSTAHYRKDEPSWRGPHALVAAVQLGAMPSKAAPDRAGTPLSKTSMPSSSALGKVYKVPIYASHLSPRHAGHGGANQQAAKASTEQIKLKTDGFAGEVILWTEKSRGFCSVRLDFTGHALQHEMGAATALPESLKKPRIEQGKARWAWRVVCVLMWCARPDTS